jgi:hypothetical protein
MAHDLSGKMFIDGIDLWNYGCFVEKGGFDDFLKYAPKKEGIEHDWLDANGKEVDLSKVFLKEREISIPCVLIADSETDFWLKYSALIAHLTKPLQRRITVTQYDNQQYFVYYSQTTNFHRLTVIKNTTKVCCRFTLQFIENEPKINNAITFLVSQPGTFIVI